MVRKLPKSCDMFPSRLRQGLAYFEEQGKQRRLQESRQVLGYSVERRWWEVWAFFTASAREASLGLAHQDTNLFAGRYPGNSSCLPYFFGT